MLLRAGDNLINQKKHHVFFLEKSQGNGNFRLQEVINDNITLVIPTDQTDIEMSFSPRALAAFLTIAAPSFASAAPINLVVNGGFEQTTLTSSQQFTTQITGWSNATTSGYTGYGYNFLIMAGTGDTSGFTSLGGNRDYFWGPAAVGSANYSNNGLTASSPTGGNYIASDGDSNFHGAISQMITGLSVGSTYQLSFDWGATQFYGYSGNTTDAWQVTLGGDTKTTGTITTASHGFSAWRTATMTFTATGATELLSFLAIGTPNGEPPTLLLDNVSLVATSTSVPEPASLAVLGAGLLGFAAFRRRRAA